jgi:membrane carboxypeptidase/penicillin-binding protein PbpC
LQTFAEKTLNQTLNELKSKNVTNWAIFAINPETWEILLYVWSRDFNSKEIDWQVNVLKSLRQPWSTMKPFLYLLALKEWAGVNDLLIDIENQYDSFQEDKVYISENYTLKEYWLVRLKKALWNSLNNASVRLAKELWLQKVYNFYKEYGFNLPENPEYYGYSLVLGNPSITLIDLVYSYSKLLNFNDSSKVLLYDILSNPDNRDISFWVNSILNTSIYQAVKTWTSSNFRDNLVVSYHPDFVLWVWIGNNDNSPMIWVTWITGAGYIWHQIIEEAIQLWYIKNNDINQLRSSDWKTPSDNILNKSSDIVQKPYCLDLNCFRQELNFDKANKEYFSKILSWIYDERDVFLGLVREEKEYLEVLGFKFR